MSKEKLKEALAHLEQLLDGSDRCRYDHNRNCQEHGYFGLDGDDCPIQQAKDFLEENKDE